jgi:lactate dehydrogenase-like 2-hydroxyacid dehydrogenase
VTPSILVTRRLPAPIEHLLTTRYKARLNSDDRQLDASELRDALRSHDIVLCTLTDRLTNGVLGVNDRRTRLLANFGAGVDHIDLAAATGLGLLVTNTPGVLTEDTADLALLLILAVARRVGEGHAELTAGGWTGWRPTHLLGTRVSGKTLGIVGYGRIGRAVAHRAREGFGMRVRFVSRRPVAGDGNDEQADSLLDLARSADFLSLHCPATPATRHLIDDEVLRAMRPSAFLINTARGDVVDEEALIRHLRMGTISGAALDVFEHEPRVPAELLAMPRVVTLPHLGSATEESRVAMGMVALDNIEAFLKDRPLPNRVV